MDKIFLRGLEVQTIIGIHSYEQQAPRPLLLDLEMGVLDTREAAASDHIRDALDYAAVAERCVKFGRETKVQLLETFGERLSRLLFSEFSLIQSLRLTIHKPGAVAGTQSLGIEIDRRREDYAICGR